MVMYLKELEGERQAKKKIDKELAKVNEALEEEQSRQKQIVLLLLAERKKIIMKWIEERKRSEDLAQVMINILSNKSSSF